MHRDLKLANILLTSGNEAEAEVKVADFGFARILNENSLAITQLGTPMFMAPEIFNSELYSFKADVWSLGVLSYEILLGVPAFLCRTLAQLRRLQKEEIKFPENSPLSAEAKSFVRSMLTYNHEERPSFQELRSHHFFREIYKISEPIQSHEIAASPEIHMEDPPKEYEKNSDLDINEYEVLDESESENEEHTDTPETRIKLVETTEENKHREEAKNEPEELKSSSEKNIEPVQSLLTNKTTDLDYQSIQLENLMLVCDTYKSSSKIIAAFAIAQYCKSKFQELFTNSEKIAQEFSLTRSRDEMFSELYDKIQMQLILVDDQTETLEKQIGNYRITDITNELVQESLSLANTNEQVKLKLALSLITIASELDPSNTLLSDLVKSTLERYQKSIRDQY